MAGQHPQMANGLHWVRGEIEQSLGRARTALEQFLETPEQMQHLDAAIDELRLVRGTVGMIQCFGAAALAEEMLQLLADMVGQRGARTGEAFAALSGATLQLSDYVDLLAHGERDRAIILQPLINELRLARGKPLVTEAELFAAQLQAQSAAAPAAAAAAPAAGSEAAQNLARRELGAFQTAFLYWFRGQAADSAMSRIAKIADSLAVNAADPRLREMWSSFAALAECIRGDLQFDSLDLKRLFGRAGSQIKRLAEDGESAAAAQVGDTPEQLLFHLARMARQTERSRSLIAERQIGELLPPLEQVDELRRRLRGPNTSILARVYAEIRRDFTQIKDGIDLAVRTGGRAPVDLAGTRERLQRLANTLGALGLPLPQQALSNQARALEVAPGGAAAWMEIATAILRVEHSLEEALFRALGRHGVEPARPYAEIEAEVPHAQDLRESVKALLRESLVDLARLKAGVDTFLKDGDSAALADAPLLFREVGAALLITDRGRAATLLRRLESYMRIGTLANPQTPRAEFERFADAVSCVEVYLEALRDGLPEPGRILEDLDGYIGRLDFTAPLAAPAEAATPAAPEPAAAEPAPVSAPVGQGIDPEIREVFIEEAGEVLAELQRQLPIFKRSPADGAVLAEVRRAFHTLKGSGRMAGALRIGEFGWTLEDMLNRCLDGALPVRTPVLQAVEDAVNLLPGLIENFRSDSAEEPPVAALMARVAELVAGPGRGEPDMLAVFREDARERLGLVRRWLETQSSSEDGFAVDAEVIRAFHTLRGSAAVIHAEGVSGLATAFENYLNGLRVEGRQVPPPALALIADALLTLLGWIDSAGVVDAGINDLPNWHARIAALQGQPAAAAAPPRRAPVSEAFCLLALDALQAAERQAGEWAAQPAAANREGAAAAALGGSLGALADAAERAQCGMIAGPARALAQKLEPWRGGQAPGPGFFATLLEVLEGLYQQLDAYREGAEGSTDEWLARVQTLPSPPPAAALEAPTAAAEPPAVAGPAAASAPAAAEIDAELLEIFGGEAAELIDGMEHYLEVWRQQPQEQAAIAELRRHLHTIKGSARTSGADAMGAVAHRLETALEQAVDSRTGEPLPLLQAPLGIGLDELRHLLFELQRGRKPEAEPALAAIEAALAAAQARAETERAAAAEAPLALPAPPVEEALPPPAPELPPALPTMEPAAEATPEPTVEPTFEPSHEPALESILEPIPEPIIFAPAPPPEPAVAPAAELPPPFAEVPAAPVEPSEPEPQFLPEQPAAVEPAEAVPAAQPPAAEAAAPPAPVELPPAPAPVAEAAAPLPHAELDDELTAIFAAEATELLEQLDVAFESWQNGDVAEAVRDVQRALHTLKGGARMAGLDAMADAAHELESRVNLELATGDFPDAAAFAQMRAELEQMQAMHDQVRRGEAALLVTPSAAAAAAAQAEASAAAVPAQAASLWAPELFWRPEDEVAGFAAGRRETARVPVDTLETMLNEAGEISIYRSRLEERNASLRTQLAEMTQTIARIREQLRNLDIETEAQIAARGRTREAGSPDRYAQDFDPLEMDRYTRMQELSRALAESIGDLASLQSSMDEAVSEEDTLLLQQSRITSEVQQSLMGTLMVPFSRQVQRLIRVVRQTAQEHGKQAEVQFQGVDAELDRNVLERITAPLEHLLRNAVVHGIEDPAARALAGKAVMGAIHVRLSREGGQLLVEVSDDGRGLDFAAIRAKAMERQLMLADTQLSDDDLARFIFEPGFSTAKRLTQDAGRGIGMDVVASEVKQLAGTLELRSETGRGTRFLLRLPLTLAVSQALLVGVGLDTYAVPLPSIEGIARIPRGELADYYRDDGPLFGYGGRGYRVRHLGDYVGVPRAAEVGTRTVTAILVRLGEGLGAGERRVALIVDALHGNREIVSKTVGPQVSSVPGVAGATILADGRVVLILDVAALVAERARRALLAEAAGRTEKAAGAEVRETIMVVDDSVTMRRVAERLLTRNGYRVITAKDGLDAIGVLQTETPATVLLDIEMPRADGFEVAAFIRNNPRLRRVPIIMITSRSGEKHRERARVLGVDRYLIKPYQEDQLLAEVKEVGAHRPA